MGEKIDTSPEAVEAMRRRLDDLFEDSISVSVDDVALDAREMLRALSAERSGFAATVAQMERELKEARKDARRLEGALLNLLPALELDLRYADDDDDIDALEHRVRGVREALAAQPKESA